MTEEERAAGIMLRMGFPDTERGPFVTELRTLIRRQVSEGLVNRSGGSWAPGAETLTYEERAKHLLAWEWEIQHGHSYRVEAIDGLHRRAVLPWLRDRAREFALDIRLWWDRKVMKTANPYQ